MSSLKRSLLIGGIVIAAAGREAPNAAGQFVPVRELDSNGAVTNDFPAKFRGGFVAGSGSATTSPEPLYWDATGTHLLPLVAGSDVGAALAADASGNIVGRCWDSNRYSKFVALLWQGGSAIDVKTLVTSGGPAALNSASDIDEKGRILANGSASVFARAFLFDQGTLVDLAAVDPAFTGNSSGTAMNDRGVAVGEVNGHAAVFENGTLTDLDDPNVMHGQSVATGVNRDGWVVGWSGPSLFFSPYAFLWDRATLVELATSPPAYAIANAINDFGVVVGTWFDPTTFAQHACTWEDGVFLDLNTLIDPASGWVLKDATDVDNEGRIVGAGTLNGIDSAFILEPNCLGSFTTYGNGCAGGGGVEPRLRGAGCPGLDRDFALEIVDGVPNGFGFFFLGVGTGIAQVKPGCDLHVMPLVPPVLPVVLDALGTLWSAHRLPAGTPKFDLNLQALFLDAGAAHGVSGTKALALHFE